uniref:Uncharacterized protein n=1 Tax=Cucumis melo TaxID=3656 RepID=A0A9I9D109_CUCME
MHWVRGRCRCKAACTGCAEDAALQGSMHWVLGRCRLARKHAFGARKMPPCKEAC